MKNLTIYTLLFLMLINVLKAQNEFDVLRYSELDHYGDARFIAMGGSFGALGANMSALSINPGGIGVYKSSDFSFTPAFNYAYSESSTDGSLVTDGKLNFHFANVGLVGNFKASGKWETVSIGIGYNRTSNYNSNISINSTTNASSLGNFTDELNVNTGIFEDDIYNEFPFSSSLAYQTFLVNPIAGDSLKYNHVFANSSNIKQSTNYKTRGGSGEMYFALGGNYLDKLYVGALVGVPTVRYVYDRTYTESADPSDTLTEFKSYTVHDYVKTTGAGVNLKLGLIYKATDWLRLGTAFHTPTVLTLTDKYKTDVSSEKKDGTGFVDESPSGSFNYTVTTPYRFVTSASVVIGNKGVVNVDYEVVDYASARLSEDKEYGQSADFSFENNNIRNNFKFAQNLRVGTEIRFDPLRVRLGYRLQGDPLTGNFGFNSGASIYSGGLGIKMDSYYLDMAYSLKSKNVETIINANENEFATTNLKEHYITFTLGFRF
ncbi:MAG: hypothetical protein ACPGSL_03550 [Vicingaceae bacterium]